MNSSENGKWIVPFQKFSRLRVNIYVLDMTFVKLKIVRYLKVNTALY